MLLHIVILAAGRGTRMHSHTPKILHKLGGQTLLARVLDTAISLSPAKIHIIIGTDSMQIRQSIPDNAINWVIQDTQLGTGHALAQALPHIPPASLVLVLSADVPLISLKTLQALIECMHNAQLALLLASLQNPAGLGRIIRDEHGNINAIVEDKDASSSQLQINEIYSGICCVNAATLANLLPKLGNLNAQAEYYLTDIIALAAQAHLAITSLLVEDNLEIAGVNNRLQLQQLERSLQLCIARELMLSGTTLADAARIDVRGKLQCGKDVFIDINNIFSGTVIIGDNCHIAANCNLTAVTIGNNCQILANSVLEHCHIADNCKIGPFAHLRPGTTLADNCKIGNFVETKNISLGIGTKACHLSYLGDASVGQYVNIGAGTITCNYDGVNKHHTEIEDGAFIGSGTQLIAPVRVGKNATIGAGSTIRKNAPMEKLTLTKSVQQTITGWSRPNKILK